MAQNIGSSSNSSNVWVQDKIQGVVDEKNGGTDGASCRNSIFWKAIACISFIFKTYDKSKGTPNGTLGVNSTPE
jgi:hypothetical protein